MKHGRDKSPQKLIISVLKSQQPRALLSNYRYLRSLNEQWKSDSWVDWGGLKLAWTLSLRSRHMSQGCGCVPPQQRCTLCPLSALAPRFGRGFCVFSCCFNTARARSETEGCARSTGLDWAGVCLYTVCVSNRMHFSAKSESREVFSSERTFVKFLKYSFYTDFSKRYELRIDVCACTGRCAPGLKSV